MTGVRWRTLGRRVSWFTGRLWSFRADDEYQRPGYLKVQRYRGRWVTVKIGLFGVALFIDRNGHHIRQAGSRR